MRLHSVLRRVHHRPRRNQSYFRNQRIEADEIRHIILFVAQRVGIQPAGFSDEFAEQLLLPGMVGTLMLVAQLGAMRRPCGDDIRQAPDQGTGKAEREQ